MRAVLLAVGDELLDGRTVDTNSVWIAGRLLELGIPVARKIVVGDALADLDAALEDACRLGELVIVTGGIGPTEDDRTRDGIASRAGVPLDFDDGAWQEIQEFFRTRGRDVPEANRRQAFLPRGAEPLSNPGGTAPGIALRMPNGALLFALPGVPSEARAMFADRVAPRLQGLGRSIVQKTIAFAGVAESELGGRIEDLVRDGLDVRVGITAHWGLIRVTARAFGADAESRVAAVLAEVRQRCAAWYLGEGRGELADFLVERLAARGERLACAESCTGGMASAAVTAVPGASAVLHESYVTYADEAKQRLLGVPSELLEQHGAVSEDCVRAMVQGLHARSGAELCLAITGIAGPGGGSAEKPVGLVWVAARYRGRLQVLERRHGPIARQQIRTRSVADALVLGLRSLAEGDAS